MAVKRMKPILQHDERDCGAACLAMISSHYGLKHPLSLFRELTKTDRNGSNLYGLVDAAEKLHFHADALSGSQEELLNGIENGEIALPFIAHITNQDGMLHFVVVYRIERGRVYVVDPGKGKKKYSFEEFGAFWNGYIVTFFPDSDFTPGDYIKGNLIEFLSLLKNQWGKLFGIIAASLVFAVIGVLGSFVFQIVIDGLYSDNISVIAHEYTHGEDAEEGDNPVEKKLVKLLDRVSDFVTGNAKHFNIFFTFLIGLYLLQAVIQLARGYLMALLAKNIDIKLVLSYYNHIIDLPLDALQSRNTGEYLSRFSDASTIRNAVSGATVSLLMDSLMAIGCGVVLYILNKKLFLVSLIMIFLYGIIVTVYRKPIKSINQAVMEDNARVESFLKESIDGVDTIKSNQAERLIKKQNETKFYKLIHSVLKNNIISFSQDSVCDMVELVGTVVILWIGFCMVINDVTTVGSLLSFYTLLGYFSTPIKNLIGLQPMLQSAGVAAERLNDILKAKPEEIGQDTYSIDCIRTIKAENVDFRYGNHELILHNMSLSIHKGEKVAIVGESGSGKTTFVKLLMRFYDYESGSITVNGKDLRDYSIEEIRKKISYVDQSTFLFSDTIKNNLILGCPDVTDEEVEQVCEKLKLNAMIDSLPFGYSSFLDENGRNLSGGQRQRLSIARALLRKPELLILDEATSNLDTITEAAIKNTIFDFDNDLTCIIIAHRLTTIKNCDRIYVMEQGEIVEAGTHEELMDAKGVYASLWKTQ